MYVKYIDLSSNDYQEYRGDSNDRIVLEKNNIFIGKNNSGKSRLMRQLLAREYGKRYCINTNTADVVNLKKNIELAIANASDYVKRLYSEIYIATEEIDEELCRSESDEEKLMIFIYNILHPYHNNQIYEVLYKTGIVKNSSSFMHDGQCVLPYNVSSGIKVAIANLYSNVIKQMKIVKPNTIYFPPMLSLRKLDNLDSEKTANYHKGMSHMFYGEYFEKLKESKKGEFIENIKTGQEVYDDMKKLLLGLNEERERFLKYEEYIGKRFFDGKPISVFIKDDVGDIYIKEDDSEYPIYHLGDGLQTLIILTYYLFMNQNVPMKVFIDEPEIHLHPGLQRLLIKELQEYSNCQFFISTHSSSIIDICDEYDENTSIICVEKVDGKKMAYNSAYDDMDLYKLIGVRPSSIILSNCTIWVEGPTDIYYIDAYLDLYRSIKDKKGFSVGYNYNYAFNGSINIASKFDFTNDNKNVAMKINKLSHNNYIIFDSDNLNEEHANYGKIKAIKDALSRKNRCHVVKKLKTIENIIPPNILKEYYERNYNPKETVLKPIVIEYFEKVNKIYPQDDYFRLDYVDELSVYVSQRVKYSKDVKKKRSLSEYRKYFQSVWNANKYELALFFANKLKSMNNDEKKNLYGNTLNDFKKMISDIYKFIAENNK